MSHRRTGTVLLVIGAVMAGAATAAVPAAAAPDSVVNGTLERINRAGVPTCFTRGGSGRATVRWGLAPKAFSGRIAQKLTVSGYHRGSYQLTPTMNASCAPSVVPGATYRVSMAYTSTAATNRLVVYRHSSAGWTRWTQVATVKATGRWRTAAGVTPRVPAGTDRISFGLSLSGNGTLITDDYAISSVAAPLPAADELTTNPSLEAGGAVPTGWKVAAHGNGTWRGSVVPGHTGRRAYAITVAGRTGVGDVKLLPEDAVAPAVVPGKRYTLSLSYRSTTTRNAVTVFVHTAAGWEYWTDLAAAPASASWRKLSVATPPIPAGVDQISWGMSMVGNGTVSTDDYSTRVVVVAPPVTGAPSAVGRWTVQDYTMPIRAMHSTVLKTGKVLLIAGSGSNQANFDAGSFKAAIWDPVAGSFAVLDIPEDMFCSGHVTLADGRVLIQGGTKSYPTVAGKEDYGGLRSTYVFDPDTLEFTKLGDAEDGHWYPTLTQLGNGDVWMAGGLKEDAEGSVTTEYFDTANMTWLPEQNAKAPQNFQFWGLYPHMFLMRNGNLFYSGGHVFGDARPGSAGGASVYDPRTGVVTDVPGLRSKDYRDQAASVLLPPAQDQRVMITGGGNINRNQPGIALTDLIDLKKAAPAYTPGPNLPGLGKMYLNATTLSDRTVLLTNGSRYNRDDASNVHTAALFDPATNTWKPVAADPIGRNYHSTAVLLPDGRVGVLGSQPGSGEYELRVSIYEPPYLFKGERPVVTAAPAAAAHGQAITFGVGTAAGRTVKWAQLVRPMSVTHQMDSNMRLVDLPVTVTGGVATATLPADPDLLPPGPYMLTVTDSEGVPSVASWVDVK